MRKFIPLLLALACILSMVGCRKATYIVEIADNYPIVNHLKANYTAGEEVTVKLETVTEHYYVLSANGEEVEMDRDASNLTYTYFTFTMPGEDVLIQIEDKWIDIPPPPQNPSEKPMPIAMTIAETLPSCVAFEYREPNTPYCFYAYDADGNLYRVLWTNWEGLNEKDRVIVEYEKLEKLTDVNPPGGWTPQYELTATCVNTTSCISYEQDAYVLTLPKSSETIKLRDDQNVFVPYITDALVAAAEKKITDDIAQYSNSSGFYLQVDENDLYLYQEVIQYLDEPKENVDCFDHEHLFFNERITLYPVNTQSSEVTDEINDSDCSVGNGSTSYWVYIDADDPRIKPVIDP